MPKGLINKIGRREFMGSAVGGWSLLTQPAALSAGSPSAREESSGNATTDVCNQRRKLYQPVAESDLFRAASKPFSGSCESEARASKG